MSKRTLYGRSSIFLGLRQCLRTNIFEEIEDLLLFQEHPFGKSGCTLVQVRQKSSGGRRPKKKIYHRVHDLDKAMDLKKKPNLILELKSIIQTQKHGALLLRDLEKHVGFVQKWNFMAVIEKYPLIFYVGGGNREPPFVTLTEKAKMIADEEAKARELMEPILVKNLRKLLMMSVDCRVPLEKIEFMQSELGLPQDFKNTLIPKYPEFFSVKDFNGRAHLGLENWDSSIAVTAREEKLSREGVFDSVGNRKRIRITKDGNFLGQYAFKISFPAGFRPNTSYLEEFEKWQRMEFPSPYLNPRRFEAADPKARKRVVAVLHELLSLTMEKRLTSPQINAFHSEYMLPSRLVLCLIKHQGLFYLTNKGARSTVFLKEAYDGSNLIEKCPLLSFYDRFVALSGRREINPGNEMQSSSVIS
ncbi:PREDICTED: protein ROOT PRIMORDIUM DEFECTIVE 1 [Tarenaya hassleriana]|uniref:protein ROOT PRIMORDIUM DEFECTIVE 1 n=1 Tax=Tarenaya hassleriana TaxID=28532 RepID=UPI00053C88CF|nr:PREDICTED: protein ROOT PRIMORDIUM DEFECTIVE 1 [Tarenaya hassleriana]XP_010531976.1 PREDICTED: protein ROOT PRIMORDIUM DEFECTIVE 1 [Tarenaya hassleriana]XP_010531977.1 PREDICTED: protein ROOT PRIMORDIUM DEFECTIVE 1 [Tarenaya hassleriana]XP_019057471.1 PREDICTED: protein ROOT PRIMORDIUM DEFECTIVE 1 [Tarenaya hassleriana]